MKKKRLKTNRKDRVNMITDYDKPICHLVLNWTRINNNELIKYEHQQIVYSVSRILDAFDKKAVTTLNQRL